jgi:hypothetical protein
MNVIRNFLFPLSQLDTWAPDQTQAPEIFWRIQWTKYKVFPLLTSSAIAERMEQVSKIQW